MATPEPFANPSSVGLIFHARSVQVRITSRLAVRIGRLAALLGADKSVFTRSAVDSFADAEFAWCLVAGGEAERIPLSLEGHMSGGEKGESNRHQSHAKPASGLWHGVSTS